MYKAPFTSVISFKSHNNPVELVSPSSLCRQEKMEILGPRSHGQFRASESGSHCFRPKFFITQTSPYYFSRVDQDKKSEQTSWTILFPFNHSVVFFNIFTNKNLQHFSHQLLMFLLLFMFLLLLMIQLLLLYMLVYLVIIRI